MSAADAPAGAVATAALDDAPAADATVLGPIALAAIAIAAFLLAVAGTLWIVAGEATFRATVEAGARILCL